MIIEKGDDGQYFSKIWIDHLEAGAVIGKNGERIREINENSGAFVVVESMKDVNMENRRQVDIGKNNSKERYVLVKSKNRGAIEPVWHSLVDSVKYARDDSGAILKQPGEEGAPGGAGSQEVRWWTIQCKHTPWKASRETIR